MAGRGEREADEGGEAEMHHVSKKLFPPSPSPSPVCLSQEVTDVNPPLASKKAHIPISREKATKHQASLTSLFQKRQERLSQSQADDGHLTPRDSFAGGKSELQCFMEDGQDDMLFISPLGGDSAVPIVPFQGIWEECKMDEHEDQQMQLMNDVLLMSPMDASDSKAEAMQLAGGGTGGNVLGLGLELFFRSDMKAEQTAENSDVVIRDSCGNSVSVGSGEEGKGSDTAS